MKNSPQIELRGKLDSLNAQIILFQTNSNSQEFISDLEEFRLIVNKIQRCEVYNKIFDGEMRLWGLDFDELHKRSHNPVKGHILLHYEMGREACELNLLRTLVRETELCAVRVFGDDDGLRIGHVLNRLSSALYVLMYKYLPENYNRVMRFGL